MCDITPLKITFTNCYSEGFKIEFHTSHGGVTCYLCDVIIQSPEAIVQEEPEFQCVGTVSISVCSAVTQARSDMTQSHMMKTERFQKSTRVKFFLLIFNIKHDIKSSRMNNCILK